MAIISHVWVVRRGADCDVLLEKLGDDDDAIRVGLAYTYLHHSQSCILSHGGFLSGLSDGH